MKKTVSVFLAAVLCFCVFAFTACTGKNGNTAADPESSNVLATDNAVTDEAVEAQQEVTRKIVTLNENERPEAYLKSDKKRVSAGETVTVEYRLKNISKATAFDLSFAYDPALLTYVECDTQSTANGAESVKGQQNPLMGNCSDTGDQIVYAGCFIYAGSFKDSGIFSASFTVNADVPSGTVIKLAPVVTSFQIAEDDMGDVILGDVADQAVLTPVEITVK